MKRFFFSAVGATLLVTGLLLAKDVWKESYTQWDRKDVQKVLNDSPWAEQYVRARKIGGKGSGIGGEKELFDTVTIRFFTSLPVRHAYYRLIQLVNGYDQFNDEQKELFGQKFSAILRLDTRERIIVAMDFSSNDREFNLRMDRFLNTTTGELFKQNATLISDRMGRVELAEYFPPSPDGTGAKFVFPRQIDGKPTVSREDKEVKIELILPEMGRVLITKKVKEMVYEGELEV